MNTDDDIHSTLKAFFDANKDGFLETKTPTQNQGFGGTIKKHPVAVVHETNLGESDGTNTWVFIDVDGGGDLDEEDLVIKFIGDIDLTEGDFVAAT